MEFMEPIAKRLEQIEGIFKNFEEDENGLLKNPWEYEDIKSNVLRIVGEIGVEITSYENDIEGLKDKIEEVFEDREWNW